MRKLSCSGLAVVGLESEAICRVACQALALPVRACSGPTRRPIPRPVQDMRAAWSAMSSMPRLDSHSCNKAKLGCMCACMLRSERNLGLASKAEVEEVETDGARHASASEPPPVRAPWAELTEEEHKQREREQHAREQHPHQPWTELMPDVLRRTVIPEPENPQAKDTRCLSPCTSEPQLPSNAL